MNRVCHDRASDLLWRARFDASAGSGVLRYGGHTSCVAVQADGETIRLPLDAGTGMQAVSALLDGPFDGTVLLGHLHWDHTLGMHLLFRRWSEAQPGAGAPSRAGHGSQGAAGQGDVPTPPPDSAGRTRRGLAVREPGRGLADVEGCQILALEIPHRGGTTYGYRVSRGGRSIAYLSDHSPRLLGPGPDGL